MKKKIFFVAMAVNALLLCCAFSIHPMGDKQNHEEQTEKAVYFLGDEEFTKIFGKPVSELLNECTKEKTTYITLLSRMRSYEQYKNFNLNTEALSKLIDPSGAKSDKPVILYNLQSEDFLNDLHKMVVEIAAYKAINKVLESALEEIKKE